MKIQAIQYSKKKTLRGKYELITPEWNGRIELNRCAAAAQKLPTLESGKFTWNVLWFVGETAVLRGWIVDKRVATSVTGAYEERKFLVTLDQPQSLIMKKGCFKAWLFTFNSSILSLQKYFERNRKLRHESAVHAYTIKLRQRKPRQLGVWHLKLQQLIFWLAERTIPRYFG